MLGNYFGQYIRDTHMLFSNPMIKNKFQLLVFYNYLALKNVFGKIFRIKYSSQNVFGYKVYIGNFGAFFAVFTELFIYSVYYSKMRKSTPIIVDAGANIGMNLIYQKYLYPKAKVYCFEPDKRCFDLLKKTVKANKLSGVKLFNAALGAKKGKLKLYSCDDIDAGTGNSLIEAKMEIEDKKTFEEVEVLGFKDIGIKNCDLLKMDIEGYENVVFKAMDKQNLFDNIQNIIFEYHYMDSSKDNLMSDTLTILEKNNYSYVINGNLLPRLIMERETFFSRKGNYILMIDAFKKK